jgi:hypothetical protein
MKRKYSESALTEFSASVDWAVVSVPEFNQRQRWQDLAPVLLEPLDQQHVTSLDVPIGLQDSGEVGEDNREAAQLPQTETRAELRPQELELIIVQGLTFSECDLTENLGAIEIRYCSDASEFEVSEIESEEKISR